MYVAISRVKSIDGLCFTEEYKSSVFICNGKVNDEYERLRLTETDSNGLMIFCKQPSV